MRSFKLGAIVSFVGMAVSFLYTLIDVAARRLPLGGSRPLGVPNWAHATIDSLLAVSIISFAFAITSFLLFRSGFLRLRTIDARFASSPTFALVAVIGMVLVGAGLGLFLAWLGPFLDCAGTTTPIPSSCLNLSTLLGSVALLGVGGIVALVGVIGTVVGIWHLGDRYGSAVFKVGAVLLILFGLVGSILVWVASGSAERTVTSAPVMPPPPAGPIPPGPPPFARPPG